MNLPPAATQADQTPAAISVPVLQQLLGALGPLLAQNQLSTALPMIIQVNMGQDPVWMEGVWVQNWLEDFHMYCESLGCTEAQSIVSVLASLMHKTASMMAHNLAVTYHAQRLPFNT